MSEQISLPVRITLPNGAQRNGWLDTWRDLLVWKELAAADDLDEFGEPEEWYWAHAHQSELHFDIRSGDE